METNTQLEPWYFVRVSAPAWTCGRLLSPGRAEGYSQLCAKIYHQECRRRTDVDLVVGQHVATHRFYQFAAAHLSWVLCQLPRAQQFHGCGHCEAWGIGFESWSPPEVQL
jgi:hypothetical protein